MSDDGAARWSSSIEQVYRAEYGRVVASLVRRFGDIDLAEEAAGEALLAAVEKWPTDGIPPNPGGWLTVTAGNRAIDRIRRESRRADKHQQALMIDDTDPRDPTGPVSDDRLRLIFTCCHPALAPEARVALTLKLLGGLGVGEIAAAFLVPETTMAQRLTRAKRKIREARIPYRVPGPDDLARRLDGVLAVVYLVFNEGYLASSGDAPVREELTGEAIRLGRVLRELLPDDPEVAGLLALMLLTEARRAARFAGGELVPLHEQDRGGWDRTLIAEGHALVRECLARNRPGHYQLMAAVNAVHTSAPAAADTDWGQIATLYAQLQAVAPSPVVALNRAVAIAELDGPEVALAEVDRIAEGSPGLAAYHALHATRADLLRRLGRSAEARAAYDKAIETTGNDAERAYLARRRASLAPPGGPATG
ncbi:MAG TPA: RNA polymerase sigma factor [Nocardioides sp.]|nr:RNA polymerase sigma factor [Nocardioides sp.]